MLKIFLLLFFLVLNNWNFLYCLNIQNNAFVAFVNNEGISIEMFRQQISKKRAAVISQFSNKYKITDYSGFWSSSFGNNQVPANILKQMALDECIKIKVQQILAKKNGIVKDISYKSFLLRLKEENKNRRKAVSESKVIYGPVEYSEASFFDHLLSIQIIELKKHLSAKAFDLSESSLNKFYETWKDSLFKKKNSSKGERYFQFDSIKSTVKTNLVDYEFDKLIDKMIKSAVIKVNNKAIDKIVIE